MPKTILYIGAPRSATTSIVKFFNQFDGVVALHEPMPIGPFDMEGRIYSLDSPPLWVKEYVKEKVKAIQEIKQSKWCKGRHYIESYWALSYFVYLLDQQISDLEIIISVRDPLMCCNSFLQFRKDLGHAEKGIDFFAKEWIKLYSFLGEQIKRLSKKPLIGGFDGLVKGQ